MIFINRDRNNGLRVVGEDDRLKMKIVIKFPYNARFDWLKQRTLSENKEQVNDIMLAFKFLLRNFDKFDPN